MDEVCVIGAGGAGLVTAHALRARGLPFSVLEASSGVGGAWRYEAGPGRSSCYASLRANTSRRRNSLRAFAMPRRGPLHPGHAEMLAYLEAFADRFGLRPHIRLGAEVVSARPRAGGWVVETADGSRAEYRALVVACGYNTVPRRPQLPGRFDGLELHAHDYRTPDRFAGLDVVVVGLGCSAAEIACELRHTAASVALAVRSSATVMPRRLGPVAIDWVDTRAGSRVPWSMRRRVFWRLIRLAAGDQAGAGLPAAPQPAGGKPLTVSDALIGAVRAGEIAVVAPLSELAGHRVRLADGDERRAQAIVYATGYQTAFPFLDPAIPAPTYAHAGLYRGVASPAAAGLFFVGLVVAHGALLPIFEAQADWAAEVLSGRLPLPDAGTMHASIAADEAVRRRDFDPGYGLAWDRQRYIRALEAESRTPRRRPRDPADATIP